MSTLPPLQDPPDWLYLVPQQVWARPEGDGTATVGITQLGIHLSGEVYMCRAKRVGTELAQGETVAVVELSKSVVAVKTPVSGTVVQVNEALEDRPELVHRDPYGAGWIARLPSQRQGRESIVYIALCSCSSIFHGTPRRSSAGTG